MPWTNQGGGSGGGGGPWGGGPSPWGRPPQGGPNVEDIIRKSQERLRGMLPGGFGSKPVVVLVVVVVLAFWVLNGFYRVQPDEVGVVLRFGAFNRLANPGLNYHLPWPIESAETPKVTRVNRTDVGYRPGVQRVSGRAQQVPEEALMLTGDENIVDINFFVLWHIKDAKAFLFNVAEPEQTVKAAAESAMREVIGRTQIASAFAEGRGKIETDTQALLQEILDSYNAGVQIQNVQLQRVDPPSQVIDAFRDVQSAKIDQQRLINEAQAYSNNVVPVAHGDASRIVQEAEAYRQQVVRNAEGDAARFLSVYDSYKQAEDVTARRLYIETMQSILQHTSKIILDKAAASSGVVPYLPLPQLVTPPQTRPTPQGTTPPGGSGVAQPRGSAR
jgi:membrane protease subunit HflK